MAREIIGDGVYRFEVRSSGACDSNTQQQCVDFLVRRVEQPLGARPAPAVARGYDGLAALPGA